MDRKAKIFVIITFFLIALIAVVVLFVLRERDPENISESDGLIDSSVNDVTEKVLMEEEFKTLQIESISVSEEKKSLYFFTKKIKGIYSIEQWDNWVKENIGEHKLWIERVERVWDEKGQRSEFYYRSTTLESVGFSAFEHVALSNDKEKIFLLLRINGPNGPLIPFVLNLKTLEVSKEPMIAMSQYVIPDKSKWSSDGTFVAFIGYRTRELDNELYICGSEDLQCLFIDGGSISTTLAIPSSSAFSFNTHFRNLAWDTDAQTLLFSTNINVSSPGKANWSFDVVDRNLVLDSVEGELEGQRDVALQEQWGEAYRLGTRFRCNYRRDGNSCHIFLNSFFVEKQEIGSEIVETDDKIVDFFEEKLVRFPDQQFSVIFRGSIEGYLENETVIVLYTAGSQAYPDVAAIYIEKGEDGVWHVSRDPEFVTRGLFRDIEEFIESLELGK